VELVGPREVTWLLAAWSRGDRAALEKLTRLLHEENCATPVDRTAEECAPPMGSESNSARLQAVEEIFHAALEREPQQVGALLDEKCTGDDSLRREVEALLAAHRQAGNFIETPVVTFDPSLLEDGDTDRLIGQSIGHYEITKRIGSGGMGVVYLARRADQQYEKLVAIKLIKRGMDTDAVLRHFRNERQILASFEHPNIARLLDGGSTESGLPYFVMEHVEGRPIDEYCDQQALSVTERLQLFRQVCAAVSYAHRRAVIHRDIKSSNILIGADGAPKLLDFGIARILQPGDGAAPAATMIGLHVMTPEYASPEQIRGEAATTVSDVYSLGVVLYRLLTGQLPYRLPSQSPYDLARAIGETEPQRPSAVIGGAGSAGGAAEAGTGDGARREPEGSGERLRRRLRGDLDNITLMALRKEPERRYQSVEQFSEDIRRHLKTLPVLARRDTLAYRGAKFVRRNAAVTAAAVLVVLALLGGIVATTWQAHRARTQEALARAEKERAERRFNEVRQLARSVLFDYHDAIMNLPGATAVRERLVRDGLVYLDSLAGEASDDSELQRELAAAYERLGDVRGQPYGASLGDLVGARESYLKALSIREALVAARPRDVQSRRDLARSYVRIGNRMLGTSEAARGLKYLRRGFAIHRELAEEQPASIDIRLDLAAVYNDLGLALEDWGDTAGALENHRKALELREVLVATDSSNPTHRRNLSVSHINLGRALVLSGDTAAALESNRKGLAMCAALFADYPNNADYRRVLAIAYQNDGDYRALLNDTAGALQSFRSKLALDEQALSDDPVNFQSRADLAYSCARIGALLAKSGKYAQALSYSQRTLVLAEELVAASPQDMSIRHGAILARASVAELHAKLGQRAVALADSAKAIASLDGTPESPTNSYQGSMRGQAYMHLGAAYAALAGSGDTETTEQQVFWRTARNMYVRSLEIWQDMKRRGILTGEDAGRPQEVAHAIARLGGGTSVAEPNR
jgi:non-specific serine/threonine protein kinase/serine/threonine-protein kinase